MRLPVLPLAALTSTLVTTALPAQTTAFSYQGSLTDAGVPANGPFDLKFNLFGAVSGGAPLNPSPLLFEDFTVINGLLTVPLDFGATDFDGQVLWIEIGVRPGAAADPVPYTLLTPRQQVLSAPYAITSLKTNGDIADAQLSNNIARLNQAQTFTADQTFGRLLAASGTSASPSLSFSLDADTGVVRPSANTLALATGGVERLRLTSGGLSGIGTTAPLAPLHVREGSAGTIAPNSNASLVLERNSNNFLQLYAPDANETGVLFGGETTDVRGGILYNSTAPDGLAFRTGGNSTKMVIDSVGNVGVGTTAPNGKLQVNGGTAIHRSLVPDADSFSNLLNLMVGGGTNPAATDGTLNGISFYESSGAMAMSLGYDGSGSGSTNALRIYGTTGTPLFTFEAGGEVGIGTTTPLGSLHVQEGVAGTIAPQATSSLVLERSGNNHIQMYAPDVNEAGIFFGGNTSDIRGGIIFNANPDEGLAFRTGGNSTKMVIDATGKVGIGTITPNTALDVRGDIRLTNESGNQTILINSDEGGAPTSLGDITMYRADGTSVALQIDADYGSGSQSRIITDVLEITGGSDLSENFEIVSPEGSPEPGMIVCIDLDRPGGLEVSSTAYDRTVAGIVSGAGGVRPGMLMGQSGSLADGAHPVALTGRVYCMIDADQGAVRPGDLITTSDTPGHGMKVGDHDLAQGAIIGKAMTSLDSGKGLVLVLVSLQ